MRTKLRGLVVAGALLVVGTASAEAPAKAEESARGWPQAVGVSLDASILLGIGLSVGVPVGDRFNVRGVYHGFTYEREFEDKNATYDAEVELKTAGLFADWHPFMGAFRLTTGLVSNGNQINLTGTDTGGQYKVGDCTFESDPGNRLAVDGVIDFKSTAPYLGIGWGGNMNAEPGFYGLFDIGVLFSGAPETSLNGRGRAQNANAAQPQCGDAVTYQDVSTFPEFQQEVQNAESDMNEETKDFKLWPNLAFGVGWRF